MQESEVPTSNWGMTREEMQEMEATKKKFQLSQKAIIHQSESPDQSTARKFDQGKARMELLPMVALNEVAKVMAFGAEKYSDHNWRNGLGWSRLVGASFRHLAAWVSGESADSESGYSHLAHAAACILMLIDYEKLGLGTDDRWRQAPINGETNEE